MSRRTRALIAALGVVLLLAGLALLVYSFSPFPIDRLVLPVAPALLVPPGGS